MKMSSKIWFVGLLALCLAMGPSVPCRAETVDLVIYYDYTPWYFNSDRKLGMNAELARRLTALSKGKYEFHSAYIPRLRVDLMLANGRQMVVPWVNPAFFNDTEKTKYLWTDPLMQDEALIVSSKQTPIEYDGPNSLRGRRLSAPVGHVFRPLSPLIDAKEIYREDAPNVVSALRKLLAPRNLDFAVVDRSVFNALKADNTIDMSKFYISKTPMTPSFGRHIMVTKNSPELFQFLSKAVAKLNSDKNWIDQTISESVARTQTPQTIGTDE
jgi:polar amino acid transport system substrate-binding protein